VEIVKNRIGHQIIGFRADHATKSTEEVGEILRAALPEDLLRFGLIPEMIGRLPVLASLEPLTEEILVQILIEPKNALAKQYKKLFKLDNVDLSFTKEALKAIAKQAIKRKTGARALRSILENLMLDIMYEIPTRQNVKKCIIDKQHVEQDAEFPIVSLLDTVEENEPAKEETA